MRPTATLLSALFLTSIFCAGASASTFSMLFKFAFETAENPHGTVFRDKDGALYGTSYFFGPGGHGVVFKLSPPPKARPSGPTISSIALQAGSTERVPSVLW